MYDFRFLHSLAQCRRFASAVPNIHNPHGIVNYVIYDLAVTFHQSTVFHLLIFKQKFALADSRAVRQDAIYSRVYSPHNFISCPYPGRGEIIVEYFA